MKDVIIGGTGLIGSKLGRELREHGNQAGPASPDTGVTSLTGESLADALDGAAVVVDVSNSPSFEAAAVLKFFETSTGNLLAVEAAAGAGHHVALSVVGTERLSQSGYFRAKVAQERLIRRSAIPYSIIRATRPSRGDAHASRPVVGLPLPTLSDPCSLCWTLGGLLQA